MTSCLKYNVLISRKKSLMGIKRHKIHQGSLCSFVLLGRSLPDIDFETKKLRLLPFDVKYMMQDPPCLMGISPGIWLQRCGAAKKKTSTYQRHTNRNARIYVYIKSLKQHTSLHLPYMRVTDISKHINKNQNGNTVFTML